MGVGCTYDGAMTAQSMYMMWDAWGQRPPTPTPHPLLPLEHWRSFLLSCIREPWSAIASCSSENMQVLLWGPALSFSPHTLSPATCTSWSISTEQACMRQLLIESSTLTPRREADLDSLTSVWSPGRCNCWGFSWRLDLEPWEEVASFAVRHTSASTHDLTESPRHKLLQDRRVQGRTQPQPSSQEGSWAWEVLGVLYLESPAAQLPLHCTLQNDTLMPGFPGQSVKFSKHRPLGHKLGICTVQFFAI